MKGFRHCQRHNHAALVIIIEGTYNINAFIGYYLRYICIIPTYAPIYICRLINSDNKYILLITNLSENGSNVENYGKYQLLRNSFNHRLFLSMVQQVFI